MDNTNSMKEFGRQRMTRVQRIVLSLALIGAFLGVLDTSIVFTGTVKMAAQLHLNAALCLGFKFLMH